MRVTIEKHGDKFIVTTCQDYKAHAFTSIAQALEFVKRVLVSETEARF